MRVRRANEVIRREEIGHDAKKGMQNEEKEMRSEEKGGRRKKDKESGRPLPTPQ